MPYLAFCFVCLAWGSTFLVIQFGNEAIAPVWAASLRLVLASLLLTALVFATGAKFPRGRALRTAVAYGFVNFGVMFILLYLGELVVPSGVCGLTYATIPIWTMLVAAILRMEPVVWRKVVAMVCGLLGLVVVYAGQLTLDVPVSGMVMIIFGAFACAAAAIILKRGPKQAAIPANAVGAAVGAIVCCIVSFVLGEDHVIPQSVAGWSPIVYLTLVGSLGGFVAYSWLLNHWPVTNASMYNFVVPIVALILGAIFRHEAISITTIIGALLVIVPLVFALRSSAPAPSRPTR